MALGDNSSVSRDPDVVMGIPTRKRAPTVHYVIEIYVGMR
jgi:hypothetical protein